MKTSLAILCLATAAAGLPVSYIEANEAILWRNFKETYGKRYSNREEAHRRTIFKKNMLKAAKLEAQNPQATFGMNIFSDMSEDEFKVYHNLDVPVKPSPDRMYEGVKNATPVDWRKKGAVTHVKNQAQCGSCWAFSSTGSIEGQWALAGNTLTSLSEQELVSCDTVDHGCGGGMMDNAWGWLVSSRKGEIVTEASYPYTAGNGTSGQCEDLSKKTVGATITGHQDIAHNEDDMASWVSVHGPLSIAVDAGLWQTYTGGVMTYCIGDQLDHGVLIVGFHTDYWIVKNSWGASWGENGYIWLQRGTNQCLMDQAPSSSIVGKSA